MRRPGESCSEVNLRLIESGYAIKHKLRERANIAAFVLADGRCIFVKRQDDMTARDLAHALRMTACGYFTTVLGPGTDPAHEAHFHFDSGLHGATPNYRICE